MVGYEVIIMDYPRGIMANTARLINPLNLDTIKSYGILGDTNSAKSSLMFHLLRNYTGDRKIYLLGYPVQVDEFENLQNFNDIFQISNSIIAIDELSKYIKTYDRKANYDLMDLIATFSHQNNTLIFTTQLTQFITKGVEAFIDCWAIKRINDLDSLKNGSKVKRIIQQAMIPQKNKWTLALDNEDYLQFCDGNFKYNGLYRFDNPNIGKHWNNNFIYKLNIKEVKPLNSEENCEEKNKKIAKEIEYINLEELWKKLIN